MELLPKSEVLTSNSLKMTFGTAFAVIKHHTSLLPPNQPLNTHSARVGSGIGALAVKKKAAARTAQEEILLELKTRKNQEKSCPIIKRDQASTKHQSEFISSTKMGRFF